MLPQMQFLLAFRQSAGSRLSRATRHGKAAVQWSALIEDLPLVGFVLFSSPWKLRIRFGAVARCSTRYGKAAGTCLNMFVRI